MITDKLIKLGAIIGGIWGMISVIFYYLIVGHGGITGRSLHIVEKILLAPAYIADMSVSIIRPFNWNLWFLLSIILGFLMGISFGYFIKKFKHRKKKWR